MGSRGRKIRWYVACLLLATGWPGPSFAQEYLRNERPAPPSVEKLPGPIVVAFPPPEPARTPRLPQVKQALQHLPAFASDMRLDVNFRSYYFLRNLDDDLLVRLGAPEKSEAWAAGGSITAQSGWMWDRVALGGELFASLPLYAPDSRPGTGLLKPIQDPLFAVGQAYVRLRHGPQVVTLGRQRYELPYLNGNDGRMVPNTFEGYSIDGRWPYGRFLAGYVRQIKLRASDDFISMSKAAGVLSEDRGLAMLGIKFQSKDGFSVGALASVVPDVFSTVYSEFDKAWTFDEWGLRVGLQFTDQRSIGDDLLTGSSFSTQSGGVRVAAGFRNAILIAAFRINSDGARIRNPYGGDPSFASTMLGNFNLANQKTFRVGLSYDGARIGLPGISGFVNYARGFDAEIAATGSSLPNDEEIDLTLDIRPDRPALRGAWLRLRAATLNPGDGRRRVIQVRLILNWALPLL